MQADGFAIRGELRNCYNAALQIDWPHPPAVSLEPSTVSLIKRLMYIPGVHEDPLHSPEIPEEMASWYLKKQPIPISFVYGHFIHIRNPQLSTRQHPT